MPSSLSGSLAGRAMLVLALMIGFYTLALGVGLGLIAIPFVEYHFISRVQLQILIACWGTGGALIWAMLPRPDRFDPPGPELTRTEAPELFTVIDDVARATEQPLPSEVYLVQNVNAWVTHRGGIMGFGSRRVMGIGLPLLQAMPAAEVRAVIAHEFGHYSGGDVALGPWVHKTRTAIFRSLGRVQSTWIAAPFAWYARMFMRMTMSISREQEFVADATAARVAGAASAASALKRADSLSNAYTAYMRLEVAPLLNAGVVPPLASGFVLFLKHPATLAVLARTREHALGEQAGEYDSHPALGERIEALSLLSVDGTASPPDQTPLPVPNADALALTLLRSVADEALVNRLTPLQWDQTATVVWAPHYRQVAESHMAWFGSTTIDSLPEGRDAFIRLGDRLVGPGDQADDRERIGRAAAVLIAGISAALLRSGWQLETSPGHTLDAVRGDDRLVPSTIVNGHIAGGAPVVAWKEQARALGLAGVPLSPPPGAQH